jgi:hypothetical protein
VLTEGFLSDHKINSTEANKRREFWSSRFSDSAVSSALSTSVSVQPVAPLSLPFLLIRKHSAQDIGSQEGRNRSAIDLAGWDLVVPREWGGVVWNALQFAGAVLAAGLRETQHLQKNADLVSFPRDFLDTSAGQAFWAHRQRAADRRNLLLPPRKRITDMPDLCRVLRHLAAAYGSAESTSSTLNEEGFPKLFIVRGEKWISNFSPPPFSPELVQALSEAASEDEEETLISECIPLLRIPSLMLLYVSLTMTGRGLPLDLAEVLCPLPQDRADWVRHAEAQRDKRRGTSSDSDPAAEGRQWRGHQLTSSVFSSSIQSGVAGNGVIEDREGRRVIGVITSGQQPHMNNTTVVIGLCDAQSLNRMFRESFGRHRHPQAHRLVLVRNSSSQWLRPALIMINASQVC